MAADQSAPIQPGVRVLDSINVRDPGFQRAQAGGITTVNVMPGSGHLLSGQTVYLKNRDANTIEGMTIRGPKGQILGGMKMANGTNSRGEPPFPGTRGKSAALMREEFIAALDYRDKLARAVLTAFRDGRIGLHDHPALVSELRATAIVEASSGLLSLIWPKSGDAHGDRACGFALALEAAQHATEPAGTRRPVWSGCSHSREAVCDPHGIHADRRLAEARGQLSHLFQHPWMGDLK